MIEPLGGRILSIILTKEERRRRTIKVVNKKMQKLLNIKL